MNKNFCRKAPQSPKRDNRFTLKLRTDLGYQDGYLLDDFADILVALRGAARLATVLAGNIQPCFTKDALLAVGKLLAKLEGIFAKLEVQTN